MKQVTEYFRTYQDEFFSNLKETMDDKDQPAIKSVIIALECHNDMSLASFMNTMLEQYKDMISKKIKEDLSSFHQIESLFNEWVIDNKLSIQSTFKERKQDVFYWESRESIKDESEFGEEFMIKHWMEENNKGDHVNAFLRIVRKKGYFPYLSMIKKESMSHLSITCRDDVKESNKYKYGTSLTSREKECIYKGIRDNKRKREGVEGDEDETEILKRLKMMSPGMEICQSCQLEFRMSVFSPNDQFCSQCDACYFKDDRLLILCKGCYKEKDVIDYITEVDQGQPNARPSYEYCGKCRKAPEYYIEVCQEKK